MHAYDHYDTLGVSRDETQHGVDAAYHDLDRHYYPAHTGMVPALRRVQQAHEVLSEHSLRDVYDREHPQLPAQSWPRSRTSHSTVELSLMEDFHGARPTADEVWHLLRANFTDLSMPKSGRVQMLDLRLAMVEREAAPPSMLSLRIPVFEACTRCHGSGFLGAFACRPCGATGYVEATDRVPVPVGPSAREAVYDLALDALGIRNIRLRLRIARA